MLQSVLVRGLSMASGNLRSRNQEVLQEQKRIEKLFVDLMREPAAVFPAPGQRLAATTKQGVYVILSQRSRPVHVGRTLRGKRGLAQRLNNHLHGQSSFTVHCLKCDGSKLRGKYP